MAEENFASPLIPEVAPLDGGNSRRSSLGNLGSSKGGEKSIPNYLRASTGSCHDFCKFGKKHEAEEIKPWHPTLKRITKKPVIDRHSVESLDVIQVKSLSAIKLKPSANSIGHMSDSSEIIKREVSPKLSGSRKPRKLEALSDKSTSGDSQSSRFRLSDPTRIKKQESSSEKEVSSKAKETSKSMKLKSQPGKKISSSLNDLGSPIGRRVSGVSNVKARERATISKAAVKNALADPIASLSPRSISRNATKQISSLKDVSSSGSHSGDSFGRKLSGISNGKAIKRTLSSKAAVKSTLASPRAPSKAIKKTAPSKEAVKTSLASSPRAPSKAIKKTVPSKEAVKTTLASSPRAPLKATKRTVASKAAAKSTLASPRASSSSKSISGRSSLTIKQNRSLKDVSSLKKVEKAEPELPRNDIAENDNNALQEKTLYVIKMETETEVFESDKNESCVVESSPLPSSPHLSSVSTSLASSSRGEGDEQESEWTETEAENEISSDIDETENLDGEKQQQRAVMDGTVCADDKISQLVKLQFRRGRVVDIQTGHNSPRRLKFRRAKTLGDNQNPKPVGRRSFRMREVDNEADDSKASEEKVVLRHQGVQGKKDAQGLFNFVIEETASKLAETRKSKVKALVGAFETVISLQEKKPASNVVS